MFTGIIRALGIVRSTRRTADGLELTVESPALSSGLHPGDSISVNGVCQTVEKAGGGEFTVTAVGETLNQTTLGLLKPGDRVNLEDAATPDTALGGHIVQGHVDGVGRVVSLVRSGRDRVLSVRLPQDINDLVLPTGSIAIDGISFTVMEQCSGNVIKITIVPFTLEHTVVKYYRSGREVNVEADIIGKYILTYLSKSLHKKANLL